jgi:hypothetical protein
MTFKIVSFNPVICVDETGKEYNLSEESFLDLEIEYAVDLDCVDTFENWLLNYSISGTVNELGQVVIK